jgi:hypothetical protein
MLLKCNRHLRRICKLLLGGITTNPLVCMLVHPTSVTCPIRPFSPRYSEHVIRYSVPETSNQELRQCLTYFFPVYCISSSTNQRRMSEVGPPSPSCVAFCKFIADPKNLLPVYVLLLDAYSNLNEREEMITSERMLGHLVDWTDPEKWSSRTMRFAHALSV